MRFGGLRAVDALSFEAKQGRDHRRHRPERRGQDDGVQLHHRLLSPDLRHAAADPCGRRHLRSGAPARIQDRGPRAGRAHVPEHPAVRRHDRARKPAGGAAQRADADDGVRHRRGARTVALSGGRARGHRQGALLAGGDRLDRARGRSGRRAALRRAAAARDRARHVHRPGDAVPRRAGGRAEPARNRRADRPLAPHPRRRLHAAADRARHGAGDARCRTTSSCWITGGRSATATRRTSAPIPPSSPPISGEGEEDEETPVAEGIAAPEIAG